MKRITVFGKGGIGKSTLSANLAAIYSRMGLKVLLVGCDPKHDTTIALTEGRPIPTVVEQSEFMQGGAADLSRLLVRGRLGVDCVESGGPEPGIGCAGRGIGRTLSLLEEGGVLEHGRYDVAVFDVLGDVVCGGFAAPLRQGFADRVVIVTSEELMSLYAANNIARAIRNYSENGVSLCGFVANLRDAGADRGSVERLAGLIGSRVLGFLERDPAVREAEYRRVTVVEQDPEGATARRLSALATELLEFDPAGARAPTPLSDETFNDLSRRAFRGAPSPTSAARPPVRVDARETPKAPEAARPLPVGGAHGANARVVEREAAWQARLWEGDPGSNAQIWGAEEQWRRFFCDFEARRNVRMSLEGSSRLVNVWHQDLECSYATPNYEDRSLPSYYKFPWPRMSAPAVSVERGDEGGNEGPGGNIMTDIRDTDVVHGGGRKLDLALAEAVKRARGWAEAIVVHSTCIPTVIGDDAEAVVRRWQARTKIPIVFLNHAESSCQELDVCLLLFKRMRKGARPARAARRVNLVGFPPGPGLEEVVGLLERCGIEVNARVMPTLSMAAARRYLRASIQVLYPNLAYAAAYKEFFEPLPLRTLRLPAPYGAAGTRRWVAAVAAEFGAQRAAARILKEAAARSRREAARGSGAAVGFVVDATHLPRLSDPELTWGIPVLRLLGEFGLGVEVMCHGSLGRAAPGFSSFRSPEELETLLAREHFQAVYSEYAYDERLARAGKAQFSLEEFEMGFEGAARTAERLLRACRWPLRRRYARYLGGKA